MHDQSDKVREVEFQMPTSVYGLTDEIHNQISNIEDIASILEKKCIMMRGSRPAPEDAVNAKKQKESGGDGLIPRLQGSVNRLFKLRAYLNEFTSELESHLG